MCRPASRTRSVQSDDNLSEGRLTAEDLMRFGEWSRNTTVRYLFLPLIDPKADVAYEEIVLRRSNWLECPLFDLQLDLRHGSIE